MQTIITTEQHTALMQFAFDQVCNKADWKAPIDCVVPYELANVYMQAIEFMTGVKPEAEQTKLGDFRLTCCGYRLGPCGDN